MSVVELEASELSVAAGTEDWLELVACEDAAGTEDWLDPLACEGASDELPGLFFLRLEVTIPDPLCFLCDLSSIPDESRT